MSKPFIVEAQKLSRAIADIQTALADALPAWFCRLTAGDVTLRGWAADRRAYADRVELAWWAAERGEYEAWRSL